MGPQPLPMANANPATAFVAPRAAFEAGQPAADNNNSNNKNDNSTWANPTAIASAGADIGDSVDLYQSAEDGIDGFGLYSQSNEHALEQVADANEEADPDELLERFLGSPVGEPQEQEQEQEQEKEKEKEQKEQRGSVNQMQQQQHLIMGQQQQKLQ